MKKQYTLLMIVALIAIITVPSLTKAETENLPKPNALHASSTPARPVPKKVGQEILNNLKAKQENAKINQELRNNKLEDHAIATGTLGRNASTTWSTSTMQQRANAIKQQEKQNLEDKTRGYMDNGRAMILNIFEQRKHNIVNELQKAVNNLHNVRERIGSRIDKVASSTDRNNATSTRDMAEARRLLVIADAKILAAQNAVDQINSLTATSTGATTASSTASSTVDLNKPRILAGVAQKAIRDAQKSLNDVVVAIAKAMGLKPADDKIHKNQNATSTIIN
ncbi:MAG: hypothetical protein WCG02_01710 [Candidatus Taylorbacteria bacterium]